jgi:ketosteroid isomerase-like protein
VDLQTLADRIEIRDVLTRYCHGIDRGDWEMYRSVFTDDAVIDYTSAGAPCLPRDEMVDLLSGTFATFPFTHHHITNVEVHLDGDTARVLADFYNPMQIPGVDGRSTCGGYYHHDMVRTPDGWRSRRLVEENVWFVNPPGAVPEHVVVPTS